MVDDTKMRALYEPFKLKERKGLGGMKFKYIPSADVIDRMNRVFHGCWSTQVMDSNTLEDQVVLQVRVTVYDPDTNQMFWHDGYGSSNIARYGSGQNKGQIIDIGNAYKSAQSMAIRNACTKFGAGLYLEGSEYEGVEDASTISMPQVAPEHVSEEPTITMIKETGDIPQTVQPTAVNVPAPPVINKTKEPEPEPVSETPPSPSMPSIPTPTATVTTRSSSTETTKSNAPKMPSIPTPTTSLSSSRPSKPSIPSAPPADIAKPAATGATNTQAGVVTDVQKAAMNGILSLKGVNYTDVCKEAFEREGLPTDNIPDKDDLNYKQAVAFIRWGTKLYKD